MSCRLLVTDVMWKLYLKRNVILCRKRTVCLLQTPGYVSTNNCPLFWKSFIKHKFWINHTIHTVYLPSVLESELFVSTTKPETP